MVQGMRGAVGVRSTGAFIAATVIGASAIGKLGTVARTTAGARIASLITVSQAVFVFTVSGTVAVRFAGAFIQTAVIGASTIAFRIFGVFRVFAGTVTVATASVRIVSFVTISQAVFVFAVSGTVAVRFAFALIQTAIIGASAIAFRVAIAFAGKPQTSPFAVFMRAVRFADLVRCALAFTLATVSRANALDNVAVATAFAAFSGTPRAVP